MTERWGRLFDDPIILADGRKLVTLRNAGEYIAALPKKTQARPEWQAAAEALMLTVSSSAGPPFLA